MKLYLYITPVIYIYIYILFEVKFIPICEYLNPMADMHSFCTNTNENYYEIDSPMGLISKGGCTYKSG